jgi:hypothetical protein
MEQSVPLTHGLKEWMRTHYSSAAEGRMGRDYVMGHERIEADWFGLISTEGNSGDSHYRKDLLRKDNPLLERATNRIPLTQIGTRFLTN